MGTRRTQKRLTRPARTKDSLTDPVARSFVAECLPAIVERFDPELVLLFGSRARGKSGEFSDLDLVIISSRFRGVRGIERPGLVSKVIRSELHWWGCGIDLFCYTPEGFADVREVSFCLNEALREGVVLHGSIPAEQSAKCLSANRGTAVPAVGARGRDARATRTRRGPRTGAAPEGTTGA